MTVGAADGIVRAQHRLAAADAAAYLALLAAAVARRSGAGVDLVPVLGLTHGLLYLAFAAVTLHIRRRLGWNGATTLTVLVLAALPLGAVAALRRGGHTPTVKPS
ncbi:MAG: DUF3817 domain-containing protein [Actinobacteria bacterium]|nr:DUF3817 domain-containing protein [Actinomycetota bacterium]